MRSVFEKIRVGNHLYVFYDGQLIYKKNFMVRPSWIFNEYFAPEPIIPSKFLKEYHDESI